MKLIETKGQTLIEFSICAGFLTLTLFASGTILKSNWERAYCAYITFESAHQVLIGEINSNKVTQIYEDDKVVEGKSVCGKFQEIIQFEKL